MGTLASLVLGILLSSPAQEEARAPVVTKEDVLRRLIAASFQAKQYAAIPDYFVELQAAGATLALDDRLLWGKGLELAGRPAEAFNLLSPLLAAHPEHRPLIKEVAQLSLRSRKFDVAAQLYQRLSLLEPDLPEWPVARANALLWAGRWREAEELLERMIHDRPDRRDRELRKALAEAKLGRRRYADAARLLEELHRDDPDDQALERRWIEALAFAGETDRARERLSRLRAAHPADRALIVQAGDLAMAKRRYSDAAVLYEEASAKGDESRATRVKLARALMSGDRFFDGARLYDRLEFEDPRDWEVRREKARLLGWKNSPAASLHEYDRLVAAFPENLGLRIERDAKSAMYRRDYRKAMAEYEELLRVEPGNSQALTDLADLYARQDMWEEAARAYRQAQEGDPANPALQENLDQLQARRESLQSRILASYSDQVSLERNIDVRRLFAGAELGGWATDALRLQGRVGEEEWGFEGGSSARSFRADMRMEYVQSPRWSGSLDLGYRQYDMGVKGQVVLDGRLRYRPLNELELEAFAQRDEFSKNAAVFFDDLYSVRGGFAGTYHATERLEIDGLAAAGSLSDGNGFWMTEAKLRYRLAEGAGRLDGHYRLHHEGFREDLPAYFSPGGFSQHGLGLLWRLDWDEPGKPKPYIELGYEIAFDSGANVNHVFQLGHRYRLAKAVDLGFDAKVMMGEVYEEKRGELFVSVLF